MPDRNGWPKYLAGEMCQTMNMHWGLGAHDFAYLAPSQIIENFVACRKVGANYLLNVGPTATGKIPAYETATVRRVGEWIANHAPCLYEGRPTQIACAGRDFVLEGQDALWYFAHTSPPGRLSCHDVWRRRRSARLKWPARRDLQRPLV
jgi:alpha-L-fucosidase